MSVNSKAVELRFLAEEVSGKIKALQEECPHEVSVYKPYGITGSWARDDYYWYECYCYDCFKVWSPEQKGKPPATLKVDRVDRTESHRVIELQIEMANVRQQ